MSLKTWVLGRVQKAGGAVVGRADLPSREPALHGPRSSPSAASDSALSNAPHLGIYGALIGAVREELEHFIASHVRLHLAIADHDRFLLTAIGVSCVDDAEARRLLLQFMREFRPEQVKRYLAREVIAALPNAAAIDLSQFAGLLDADARSEAEDENEYAELLAALRSGEPGPAPSYKVNIVGRWTEFDGAVPAQGSAAFAPQASTPSTPLAGQRCDFDIEDGDGRRRVVLQSVIPGRRYMIGKGEGCDIRVNGSYTSRCHAEIWLENGSWRVGDAGSTNGLRVETPGGTVTRCGAAAGRGGDASVELVDGARIVLSAQAEGAPSDYPSLALRSPASNGARVTPIAAAGASMATPVTPIHPPRPKAAGLTLTARGVNGERQLELVPGKLPISVGRSRNQALVVGRAHELVSGHHLDIVDIDDSGAQVLVHGDNGVVVEGVAHAAGTHFMWKIGQTMLLGAPQQPGPPCSLALSRRASA